MAKILDTLRRLGSASAETIEVYAQRTRDVEGLTVYRDRHSGVIFIDDYYTGDDTYRAGSYREDKKPVTGKPDFERFADCQRRFADYRQFVLGKDVLDFGCGEGLFLRKAKEYARSVTGVELEQPLVDRLNLDGIRCATSFPEGVTFDTCFLFHVAEHLPEPIETLSAIRNAIRPGGFAIVEVPHANDLLLASEQFKAFTLWSQHLILHTRESLRRLIIEAGFSSVSIQGKQRYPLSNHLNWLLNGRPGGHKMQMSALDSPALSGATNSARPSDGVAQRECAETKESSPHKGQCRTLIAAYRAH